jgi:hypothetical protein
MAKERRGSNIVSLEEWRKKKEALKAEAAERALDEIQIEPEMPVEKPAPSEAGVA